jgi:four helix bundle protein
MPLLTDPALLEWEERVPEHLRKDALWRFQTYRAALYLLELAAADTHECGRAPGAEQIASQLIRAVASISANISEGYGRRTIADRARFYGIALGSVRESVTWYIAAARFLPSGRADLRTEQLTEIRRLLVASMKALDRRPPGSRAV